VALLVFIIFFILGPPLGEVLSYRLNITWGPAFAEQFFAGDLYPRWLFGLNQGAGSPVFYFYGPFPFWINAIFGELLCSGCALERSVMIGPCVLLALSGISFYYWTRLYARPLAALLAAILYVFLPYHFAIDLWYRQALGEFSAYVWMPVILLGLAKASTSTRYLILAAAGYAGLIYSHLPSALLFSPVMVWFVLIRDGLSRRALLLIVPVVLGIGLAALYLFPALTTQEYINASHLWDHEHFDPRNWLWLDGRDAPRFADVVLPALLTPTVLGVIMAGGLFFGGEGRSHINIFIVVSLVYAWYLMTYPSSFLWEQVALLRKVQFPWRVGIVVDLCAATMFAIWLEWTLARKWLFKTTLCLTVVAFGAYYGFNANKMYHSLLEVKEARRAEEIRKDVARGFDALEYRTSWSIRSGEVVGLAALAEKLGEVPDVSVVSGEGTVRIVRQELDHLSVIVEATTPVRIRFRRFYYPGWHLTGERGGELFEINASEALGLLETRIPSGTHRLILERLPIKEERIGAIISIASLIACLLLLAPVLVKKRKSQSAATAA
jgi:hypothetical protein